MRHVAVVPLSLLLLTILSACAANRATTRSADDETMFGPASMRIHPTFTQVKDWQGTKKPDGIEAVIELQDEFGEPTRAAGTVYFELYNYRAQDPEPRGTRLANWAAPLLTREQQLAHWNPAVRGYSFQLTYDKIALDRAYVLTAQFDRQGGRFFSQLIVEATREGRRASRVTPRAAVEPPGH